MGLIRLESLRDRLEKCKKLVDQPYEYLDCGEKTIEMCKEKAEQHRQLTKKMDNIKAKLELEKLDCVEDNISESEIRACFSIARKAYLADLKPLFYGLR